MRHIALEDLCELVFGDDEGKQCKQRLAAAQETVKQKSANNRQGYINRNGSAKWSPVKNLMTVRLGNKCWYTEAELVGADLTIDHYRPKRDYWWLAFEVSNYRIACPFANSPKHNA